MSTILRPIRLKLSGQPVSCWPATIHDGEPTGDIEHAERRDEGRQPEADREQRVDHAGAEAGHEADQDGKASGSRPSTFRRIGGGAARQRQHRADREVDIAGGNDIGQADRRATPVRYSSAGWRSCSAGSTNSPAGDRSRRTRERRVRMIARASRRARNLPKPRAVMAPVGCHGALGLHAFDRDAAGIEHWRRRLARAARPIGAPGPGAG